MIGFEARRVLIAALTITLTFGASVGFAAPAGVQPSWSAVSSPTPDQPAQLVALACASAASCVAGGRGNRSSGPFFFVEQWNGSKWSYKRLRHSVNSFSCASPTDCVGVGYDIDSVHWNGVHWSVTDVTDISGILNGVSCPIPASCFAVGQIHTDPLIAHWDGAHWTEMPAPKRGALRSIDCPSATSCFAVGTRPVGAPPGRSGALVLHWNGSSWSAVATVDSAPVLKAIDCADPTHCMTIGAYPYTGDAFAAKWNGKTWSKALDVNPGHVRNMDLERVSCPRSSSCFAVGAITTRDPFATDKALILHWDGNVWAPMRSPSRSGHFNDVACQAPPVSCFSAGYSGGVGYHSTAKTLVARLP